MSIDKLEFISLMYHIVQFLNLIEALTNKNTNSLEVYGS